MTRFARAKGSKSSNERLPEKATSWGEIKQQLEQKNKEIELNEKFQEAKVRREANYKAFLDEKEADELKNTKWADFPGIAKTPSKSKVNNKTMKQKIDVGIKNTPKLNINGKEDEEDIDNYNESDDEEFHNLKAKLDEILDKKENDDDTDSDEVPEEASAKKEVAEVVVKKTKKDKKKLLKIVVKKDSEQSEVKKTEKQLKNTKPILNNKVQTTSISGSNDVKEPEETSELTDIAKKRIEKKKLRRQKQVMKKMKVREELKLQKAQTEQTEDTSVDECKTKKVTSDGKNDKNKKKKRQAEDDQGNKNKKQKILKKPEELTEEDKEKIEKKRAKKLKQLERRKLKKEKLKLEKNNKTENENGGLEGDNKSFEKINNNSHNVAEENSKKNFEKNNQRKQFDKPKLNSVNKKNPGKVKDNDEHSRRKPFLPTKMMINGKEVEIDYIDGFPVKKEDGIRLKTLRKEMISKGLPRSEINVSLKLERRKAEKAFAREKKRVCFNCRKSGHNLSECPELDKNQVAQTAGSGICFKCGSTEHTHFECKVVRGQEFKFASCFICNEQGHIARQCPDNARGMYPKGGACNVCGDVTHLKKDCPKYQANQQKETDSINLETFNGGNPDILDNSSNPNNSWKHKPNKIIKF